MYTMDRHVQRLRNGCTELKHVFSGVKMDTKEQFSESNMYVIDTGQAGTMAEE
jgi:hypothetical protein